MKHLFDPCWLSLFSLISVALVWSGCGISLKLPKHATVQSEQPPAYYLGRSPRVYVVEAQGATRTLQDVAIEELRSQSRSNGHFTVENRLDEGIRFDVRQGQMVMTGTDVPVRENDVFIKLNIIASMEQDSRTTITQKKGLLNTEEEQVPAHVTIMPVAFTVTRGTDVLLNERQYDGRAVWPLGENGDGYPTDRYRRYEVAIGQAVKEFLSNVTPRYVSREARLDYHTDEKQQPILDAALNGQVKEAAMELNAYVEEHPNSASAVYNLAVLTDVLRDYKQAIEHYNRAISLGGKDYYTEVKTEAMRRLSEQRALEEAGRGGGPPIEDSMARGGSARETASSESERPGNGGEDVAWVQRTLNELGYDCGAADGIMGSNTESCIRTFQEANGLKVTGSMNEATYETMLKILQ